MMMTDISTARAPAALRPDYGLDAPGVVRALILGGFSCFVFAGILYGLGFFGLFYAFALIGAVLVGEAAAMIAYARRGKFRHRARMLNLIDWRGDEQVLDVGTGRGLLLIGAAKILSSGRAVGIDIWNSGDLSSNALWRTAANLAAEGVADRCELLTQCVQDMLFPDASFDVVLSNLCLHNIKTAADRDHACREIARVLKPGGVAIISDLFYVRRYAEIFRSAGLSASRHGPYVCSVFPPQTILVARKLG